MRKGASLDARLLAAAWTSRWSRRETSLFGADVDLVLQRFLRRVRGTARRDHLATYEDLTDELERYLHIRRRSAARLAGTELRRFLGYWYLRNHGSAPSRRTRRFCAAARVLIRWLAAEAPPRRRAALLRESRALVRATARAARASELLERVHKSSATRVTETVEDYFEVVARGRAHVALRPISRGESFASPLLGPVAVPEELAASLDPGVLLNLQLGRADDRWSILDYGYCYPSSARAALCDALLMEAH
jgi:hypothetical protein